MKKEKVAVGSKDSSELISQAVAKKLDKELIF